MKNYFPTAVDARAGAHAPRWPWGVLLLASVALTYLLMTQTQLLAEPRVSLERYVGGAASKPFCFRALVPWLMSAIGKLVPATAAAVACPKTSSRHLCALLPADGEYKRYYFALFLILGASVFVYGWRLGTTYRLAFGGGPWTTWLVTAGAFIVHAAVIRIGGYGHVYDFTVMALSAAMLHCLLFGRLPVFVALFAIASWTKETTIFMLIAFVGMYFDKLPRWSFLGYLVTLLIAYATAQLTVRWLFARNDGGAVELWYIQQWAWFERRPLRRVLLFAVAALACFSYWSKKPPQLRRAVCMVPPHVALFFYGGQPAEWRALYESFPVLLLLAFSSVSELFRSLPSIRNHRERA